MLFPVLIGMDQTKYSPAGNFIILLLYSLIYLEKLAFNHSGYCLFTNGVMFCTNVVARQQLNMPLSKTR